MERFPTWQVWRLIHTYPSRDIHLWGRILRTRFHSEPSAALHNAWTWVMISFATALVVNGVVPNYRLSFQNFAWLISLASSLIILIDSLRFGMKISASISKAHELENYDLLALPAGQLESMLNICRAHRFCLNKTIHGMRSLPIVIILLTIMCILALSNDNTASNDDGLGAIIVVAVLALLIIGLMRYVDYMQSFISAIFIAILVSQRQNRGEAQSRVIGGFLALQIVLYLGLFPVLLNLPLLWWQPLLSSSAESILYGWWVILLSPIIFALCRELVNFALWQAVKRRLEA